MQQTCFQNVELPPPLKKKKEKIKWMVSFERVSKSQQQLSKPIKRRYQGHKEVKKTLRFYR